MQRPPITNDRPSGYSNIANMHISPTSMQRAGNPECNTFSGGEKAQPLPELSRDKPTPKPIKLNYNTVLPKASKSAQSKVFYTLHTQKAERSGGAEVPTIAGTRSAT